ncbi:MAG: molybdopterin molybdotransferase MoeA [Woeseiaceae bacterium]|nr:molybdopterin molybdotransferase MoeA [Woeseiaceae bacterium]
MLTTAQARERILAAMQRLPAESVSLAASAGRVLRQTIVAERDQPPFDRVMMDGIAVAYDVIAAGNTSFPIQATQAAGDAALGLDDGAAIEIMTGAALPSGADCIIPVERIAVANGVATLESGYRAERNQFVHPRASDHAAGTHLLQPGRHIAPADIAVIASAGLATVDVTRPVVARVISTGNELIAAGEAIAPHQVRMSNGPALVALLARHGHTDCGHEHIADNKQALRERIGAHLDEADTLILSGGVSMGKADYVPAILAELGVTVSFHRISQRPGKPMWFGTGPRGQAVFALPGNPVSALVCCRQYVLPALAHASGLNASAPEFASLASEVTFKPNLTCFQPVKLVSNAAGQVLAMPVKTNTSGDFTALSGTDGYVELAQEETHFTAGTSVILRRW